MLDGRQFVLKQIFPEGSTNFGELGAGWVGVELFATHLARRDFVLFPFCIRVHFATPTPEYRRTPIQSWPKQRENLKTPTMIRQFVLHKSIEAELFGTQ